MSQPEIAHEEFPPVPVPARSELGLASCVISAVVYTMLLGDIAFAIWVPSGSVDGSSAGSRQAKAEMAGIVWCFGTVLAVVGEGLAIAAVFQRSRSKKLPLIGIGLNSLPIFLVIAAVLYITFKCVAA